MTQEKGGTDNPPPKAQIVTISGGEIKPRLDDSNSVAERLLKHPTVIHIFTDSPDRIFDPARLAEYIKTTFGPNFAVEYHGDITQFTLSQSPDKRREVVASLAKAKCATNRRHGLFPYPLSDEEKIQLENQALDRDIAVPFREFADKQARDERGIPRLSNNDYYEIFSLGDAFRRMIPDRLRGIHNDVINSVLIISGRGIGEKERGLWGDAIHMRAGFSLGALAVVSTTGLVEAPGKPLELERAYQARERLGGGPPHFDRQEYNQRIFDALHRNNNVLDYALIEQVIEKIFTDRMLHYEDPRLNEAVKGSALSMIMFTLGEYGKASQCSTTDLQRGEPDLTKTCRLHDGHWQEEVIASQIKEPQNKEFCDYHQQIFDKLKQPPRA